MSAAIRRGAAALLVLGGVALYARSLSAPWVWDDKIAILENPAVRALWPLSRSLSPPSDVPMAGRPIANLSLALCYALGGGYDVRIFRAFNLAVHCLAALALFGLARRALATPQLRARFGSSGDGLAFACALLWLVHPLGTECVAYVTQRSSSLMALFFLLTLYGVVRSAASPWPRAWHAAAVLACALGMASKEEMVAAPVVVLLFDRAYLSGSFALALRERLGLYAGLGATWGLLAWLVATGPDYARLKMGYAVGVGPFEYLVSQGPILLHYLRLVVWPTPQILDYGVFRPVAMREALPSLLVLGSLFAASVIGSRRAPRLGFLGLAFFAVLAPTSSVVPVGGEVGAERRMLLPLTALAALFATAGCVALARGAPRLRAPLLAAVTAALAATSAARLELYREPVELWRSVTRSNPKNPRGFAELANQLDRAGRPVEAIASYREALRLDPGYFEAHNNLGTVQHKLGRLDLAVRHYREALRLWPRAPLVNFNLARALEAQGAFAEAAERLGGELEVQPAFVPALRELAWLLATHPDPALRAPREAVRLARRAWHLDAGADPLVLDALAASYAAAGRFPEAIAAAERALSQAGLEGAERRAAREGRLALYRSGSPFVQPDPQAWEPLL
jgi:tetratricopeptide (TPR) repeat protein